MAELLALALHFQQKLDSAQGALPSAAAEAAGTALCRAIVSVMQTSPEKNKHYRHLEPIITRTTLAASIVAHWERIPWTAVTPSMLSSPSGTPLGPVETNAWVLNCLCVMAEQRDFTRGTAPALLLRQVLLLFLSRLLPRVLQC